MRFFKILFFYFNILSLVSLSTIASGSRAQADFHKDFLKGVGAAGAAIAVDRLLRGNSNTNNSTSSGNQTSTPQQAANPAAAQEPEMSRDTRRQVQMALNELSFNVGTVDGLLGQGSRGGIRKWQTANGYAATGYLTNAQLEQLLISESTAQTTGDDGGDFDGGEYAHIGTRPIPEYEWLHRRIAEIMLKQRPGLLEDQRNADRWFRANVLSSEFGDQPQLGRRYLQANDLEKEDIRNEFLAKSSRDIDNLKGVSPQEPLRLAIYERVNLSKFVEGKGLFLRHEPIYEKVYETAFLQTRLQLTAAGAETNYMPVDREAAKVWIDRARSSKRNLIQVFWGRVEGIGEDKTLDGFATQKDGVFRMPSTFVLERVTLHFQDGGSNQSPEIDAEPVFEWVLETKNEAPATSANSGLEFARNIGMQIRDGHVYPGRSSGPHTTDFRAAELKDRHNGYNDRIVMQRFAALTRLGIEPEWAERGTVFAGLAYFLFSESEKKAFFGDKAGFYSTTPTNLIDERFGQSLFDDEFALRNAKQKFIERDLPNILARTPKWPMPVLNVARVSLGQYDFDSKSFPLSYGNASDPNYTFRVATLFNIRGGAIMSADWIGNLPGNLEMTVEQAEHLSSQLGDYRVIYLAWKADLDMSKDGTLIEARVAQDTKLANGRETSELRPGRATLKEIGFYQDEDLTIPLRELDPNSIVQNITPIEIAESSAKATTGNESIDTPEQDFANSIQAIPLASAQSIFADAMDAIGTPDMLKQVLSTTPNIRTANEFNIDEAYVKEREKFAALPRSQDIWIESYVVLGTYDLDQGRFSIEEVGNLEYEHGTGEYRFGIELRLAKGLAPTGIEVPRALAEKIVTENSRRLTVKFRSEVSDFKDISDHRGVIFEVGLIPEETIFFREHNDLQGQQIVAVINPAEEAEKFGARTFSVDDFAGLEDELLLYTGHVRDLILVKYASAEIVQDRMEGFMQNAAYDYENGNTHAGPLFFNGNPTEMTPVERSEAMESFESWMTAKADAMGERLLLAHTIYFGREHCAHGELREHPSQSLGPIVTEISTQDDFWQYYQASTQTAQHAYMYAERSLVAQYSEIDPVTRQCDYQPSGPNSFEVFVLKGATTLRDTFSGTPHVTRQLELEIKNVAITPDTNIEFRIDADVVSTSFLNGAKFGLNEKVDVSFDGSPPTDASRIIPAIPIREMVKPTQVAINNQETEAWPEAIIGNDGSLPEDIRSGFDIIGVRAGQSFDEAESIIREQINPIAEFASKSAPDQPSKTGFIRAFMNEDATQTIALFGPTENGPVIAVSRSFWRNGSTWPIERVVEGMLKKYGEGERYSADDRSIWWSKSSSSYQSVCTQLPLSSPDGRFWEMEVVEGDPSSINWLDPLTYSPAIPFDQEGNIQNQRECDSVVQLTVPTGLESQSAQLFSIFLYAPQIADAVDFPKEPIGEQIDIEF